MKIKIFFLAVVGWTLAGTAALENNGGFTISEVTVKARQPWQDYVDVDFTLTAPAGREDELTEMVVAVSNGLDRVMVADTSLHAPLVKHGRNRFIWNAGTSYSGTTLGKVRFYLAVAATNVQAGAYFTVNLHSGERNWYPDEFSNRVTAAFYKTEYMPFRYIPSTVSQEWKELAGTKKPNRWGLYDMVGCVHNWTTTLGRNANNTADSSLVLYADDPAADPNGILVDPVGCLPPQAYGDNTPLYRVTRGSHYGAASDSFITDRFGNTGSIMLRVYRSAYRYAQVTNGGEVSLEGFRLCLTEEEADTEWFPQE